MTPKSSPPIFEDENTGILISNTIAPDSIIKVNDLETTSNWKKQNVDKSSTQLSLHDRLIDFTWIFIYSYIQMVKLKFIRHLYEAIMLLK